MKKKIRETFLNIRKNKYCQLSNKNKTFIAKQIKSICINKNINYLGFYYPINYEINIISVIVRLKINKIKFCLPVIEKNNKMMIPRGMRCGMAISGQLAMHSAIARD